MITRGVWPGWAHSPGLPPPLCHVHPSQRQPSAGRYGVPGRVVVVTGGPGAAGASGLYDGGQRAPRGGARGGGLIGGAVNFAGTLSTPGGSSGYGYLGMDITDPGSWPRPFNPQRTTAWFCYPQEAAT